MTALADIREAITAERERRARGLLSFHLPLTVVIGMSAKFGIEAETNNHKVPKVIDDVPVEFTDLFPGWMLKGASPRPASESADAG